MTFVERIQNKLSEVKKLAKEVEQLEGKTTFDQYIDIATLLRMNPTCNPLDYYDYGLYKHIKRRKYLSQNHGWRHV